MNRLLKSVLALALTSAPSTAQAPAPATSTTTAAAGPEVHKLAVSAQAPAEPALRYRLLPPGEELTAGNGATVYLAGMTMMASLWQPWHDDLERFAEMEVEELPLAEVKKWNAPSTLKHSHVAARRERCEWDMPLRENGLDTVFPHFNYVRSTARLISINVRLALAEKRFDDAAYSLQTGFALTRDVQGDNLIVSGMLSGALANLFLQDVQRFIDREGAPNLYWPLANLPRPIVDVSQIMSRERALFYYEFPALRDPRASGLTDAQWQAILVDHLREFNHRPPTDEELEKLQRRIEQINAGMLPKAKVHLKAKGLSDAEVRATPAAQLIATYAVAEMERWRDAREKWLGLPFHEAIRGLRETNRALREAQATDPNPLLGMGPATSEWFKRLIGPDRRSAALQTIEAIRAHGKIPATLAEVTLPLPNDPATGQPFLYEPRANGFTLISRIHGGAPSDELRYEVTMK